jgi:two-component system response regulator FixJ
MTIAVIEDHEAALESLCVLLRTNGLTVAGFSSAEAFLASLPELSCKCIVTDVRLPGMSGVDLQRAYRAQGRDAPIILITGHGDISMAVKAMKGGAFDFIEKPYAPDAIIESVRNALAAEEKLRSSESQRRHLLERIAVLTPRQKEVMQLVAEGLSTKEIAQQLGISPRTVETHRAWVMERMEARNLGDLVRKVLLIERAI